MTQSGILGMFAGHEFLSGLCERHLMTLAAGARPFRASPGECLAKEGQTANAFYLIQSGSVELGGRGPHGEGVPIQTVGPGEVVGWSWLVSPHRWQFDCVAKDEVQGISFDAEWLREKCEQDHELGFCLLRHLVGVVANRLAGTRRKLQETQAEMQLVPCGGDGI